MAGPGAVAVAQAFAFGEELDPVGVFGGGGVPGGVGDVDQDGDVVDAEVVEGLEDGVDADGAAEATCSDRVMGNFRGLSQDPLPDGRGSVWRRMPVRGWEA